MVDTSDLDEHLSRLRAGVEELAAATASAFIPSRPVRTFSAECDEHERRVWHEGRILTVLTCDGGIFVSGHERFGSPPGDLQCWPDWTALTAAEAREIANALLAAVTDTTPRHLAVVRPGGDA